MARWLLNVAFATAVMAASPVASQEPSVQADRQMPPNLSTETAPVIVDGRTLFELRGASALPSAQRAAAVSKRIKAVAADASIDAGSIALEPDAIGLRIAAGATRIVVLVEADAELEGVSLPTLGQVILTRTRMAVESYRTERSADVVKMQLIYAAVALTATIVLVFGFLVVTRLLMKFIERRYKRRIEGVKIQSFRLVRGEQVYAVLSGFIHLLRSVVVIGIIYLCAVYVLDLFVWTRPIGNKLVDYMIDPIQVALWAIVESVPDLVFIAIIILITRGVLRLTRLLFRAIEFGYVRFASFEQEWARPTYRLVRWGIIALALVIAYPYIPGSSSAAFQGVSIFIGVILSLGSSSIISNVVAGYSMIYRRAFAVGDWIQVGGSVGEVVEMRLLMTRLRSPKNESIVLPNSQILNSEVVNFSTLAKEQGLLLHTSVGIGYEVPWRQVEGLLIEAARRTEGILADPPPFVLEKALGDFAVTYELNAASKGPESMPLLYALLHRNILDVFTESGIQIMTPNYVADPEVAKIPVIQQQAEAGSDAQLRRLSQEGSGIA